MLDLLFSLKTNNHVMPGYLYCTRWEEQQTSSSSMWREHIRPTHCTPAGAGSNPRPETEIITASWEENTFDWDLSLLSTLLVWSWQLQPLTSARERKCRQRSWRRLRAWRSFTANCRARHDPAAARALTPAQRAVGASGPVTCNFHIFFLYKSL